MSTEELLEKLLERLGVPSAPVVPQIPVAVDAWDIDHIARYMKRTPDTVRRDIVVQPTFPRAMRLPGASKSRALYKAREVVAWLESQ